MGKMPPNQTDRIARDILNQSSSSPLQSRVADLHQKFVVLETKIIETSDEIDINTKKLLKEHLVKVNTAVNGLQQDIATTENVLKHFLNVFIISLSPANTQEQIVKWENAWMDAKPVFEEFLKLQTAAEKAAENE